MENTHYDRIFQINREKGTLLLYKHHGQSHLFTLGCILATCTRDDHHCHNIIIKVEHSQIKNEIKDIRPCSNINDGSISSVQSLSTHSPNWLRIRSKTCNCSERKWFETRIPNVQSLSTTLLRDWRFWIQIANMQSLSTTLLRDWRLWIQIANMQSLSTVS